MTKDINLAPEPITKKDIRKAWLRNYFACEIPHSYDRYVAGSMLWGLMPILRKLYKNNDDLIDAYQRQLLFYNSHASWGSGTITGVMASLEETRAKEIYNEDEITVDTQLINSTKTGLMGPLAGIGDSIDAGTIMYIFVAIALPWAQQGNIWGALFPFIIFSLYQVITGYYFTKAGYTLGRSAIDTFMSSTISNVIDGLSILGLFMMGILAASYVNVNSSLAFTISGHKFVIQDMLDKIMPGLLSLLTVSGVYFYFTKKGLNVTRAILWLTAILIVLALIGVL